MENITEAFCVDEIKRLWREELAEHYVDKPRLHRVLLNTPLYFTQEESRVVITFEVLNEAQKLWVERHLIHELNNSFKAIIGKQNIKISVRVGYNKNGNIYIIDTVPPHIPIDAMPKVMVSDIDLDIN